MQKTREALELSAQHAVREFSSNIVDRHVLSTTFQHMPVGVVVFDNNRDIQFCNTQACEILGVTKDDKPQTVSDIPKLLAILAELPSQNIANDCFVYRDSGVYKVSYRPVHIQHLDSDIGIVTLEKK